MIPPTPNLHPYRYPYRSLYLHRRLHRARITCTILFLLAAPAFAEDILVKSGDSIQDAIDAAAPGDVIRVAPDTYQEALTIRTEGIAIIAADDHGRAVLDSQGQLEGIRIEADDVRVEGFVVRNAMAAGVVAYKAGGVTLRNLIVEDNHFIGISIADSTRVTVENAVTAGHGSAGILIAQSTQVRIAHSDSFDNLTGIRIENSDHFEVENCTIYRNATGIAAVSLPNRSKPRSEYGRLLYNRILDNNRPSAADPGTVDAAMIPGVGLYIVATDHLEAAYNRFERNGTYAAITLSLPNSTLPDRSGEIGDPNTDHLYIHHNRYADNGAEPSAEFQEAFPDQPAGDLYWDETGERNQWQESGEFRTVPEKLVQQQGGAHTNVIHFI